MFNNFVFILTKVANHAQYKVEDSCTKETPSLAEIVMVLVLVMNLQCIVLQVAMMKKQNL